MSGIGAAKRNKYLSIVVMSGAILFPGLATSADTPMTAGLVLERMSAKEFYAFVAGITEGLAYQRYVRDGSEAMTCVYGWFYEDENSLRHIDQAFERFPGHSPGAVMAALVKRHCGE